MEQIDRPLSAGALRPHDSLPVQGETAEIEPAANTPIRPGARVEKSEATALAALAARRKEDKNPAKLLKQRARRAELHAEIFARAMLNRPFKSGEIVKLGIVSKTTVRRELNYLKRTGLLRRNGRAKQILPGDKTVAIFTEALLRRPQALLFLVDYALVRTNGQPKFSERETAFREARDALVKIFR